MEFVDQIMIIVVYIIISCIDILRLEFMDISNVLYVELCIVVLINNK